MIEKIKQVTTWQTGAISAKHSDTSYQSMIKFKLLLIEIIRQFACSGIDKKGVHYYNDCALSTLEDVFEVFGFSVRVSSKELDKVEKQLRSELEDLRTIYDRGV
jgi:hypothetical protein